MEFKLKELKEERNRAMSRRWGRVGTEGPLPGAGLGLGREGGGPEDQAQGIGLNEVSQRHTRSALCCAESCVLCVTGIRQARLWRWKRGTEGPKRGEAGTWRGQTRRR